MEFNLGDLFEGVVDAVAEREALVLGHGGRADRRLTYGELDARANRLAHVFADLGVGVGDHVGLHLHNGIEYLEGMLALYKLRATPVNVNYRYVADELAYLFADADLKVVVTEPDLEPVVASARIGLPLLRSVLVRGAEYEARLAAAPPTRPEVGPRSADDLYLLYTGGTTGMPKGVMWRHEDIYFASLGGRGTPSKGVPALVAPDEIGPRAVMGDPIMRRLPLCPLMHGGAMWVALQTLLNGGVLVIATDRHFDAHDALGLLASERVELTMVIGDATARPLADALAAAPDAFDLSALQVIASGGAILSPTVKAQLGELLPHTKVVDTFGASETGGQGRLAPARATAATRGAAGRAGPGTSAAAEVMVGDATGDATGDAAEVAAGIGALGGAGAVAAAGGPPRLLTDADTAVLDDDDQPVVPGSGQIGRLARTGHIPFGYYKDPVKSAATFPVIDGRRWSVPGDLALVAEDGSITLLGRGVMCINTGGEKVFPEEVEGVIKSHPAVFDALVVGIPDDRFGQRVVGVVALRPDHRDHPPAPESLDAHTRAHVSGYKVPRDWVVVDECRRSPTGKPDYAWATTTALDHLRPR